jgi:acylphosphatase
MSARLLRIEGRVQGVGYRDWARRRAERLGLAGYVRNRPDGSVEVLAAGPAMALDIFITACRHGPPSAHVSRLEHVPAEPPEEPGFRRLPTG